MFHGKEPHPQFDRLLLLTALTFIIGISCGVWWTLSALHKTKQSREGVLQLVSTIRQHLQDGSLPDAGYSDISALLVNLNMAPLALLDGSQKLQTPWSTPLTVALNRDSAVPAIEVTFKGLNYNACSRIIAGITKGFTRTDDLRSVWIGPPGVILDRFPVTAAKSGCEHVLQQVTFQFHLQPHS